MDFITLDMLLSLAGCILIVTIITETLKRYFAKTNPLKLNFYCSLITGLLRIIVVNDFTIKGIVTGILNVFVIMLAAGGSYDTVKTLFEKEGK